MRKYRVFVGDVLIFYNSLFYCMLKYGGIIIGVDLRRYS